jgi:hypothetical protein
MDLTTSSFLLSRVSREHHLICIDQPGPDSASDCSQVSRLQLRLDFVQISSWLETLPILLLQSQDGESNVCPSIIPCREPISLSILSRLASEVPQPIEVLGEVRLNFMEVIGRPFIRKPFGFPLLLLCSNWQCSSSGEEACHCHSLIFIHPETQRSFHLANNG